MIDYSKLTLEEVLGAVFWRAIHSENIEKMQRTGKREMAPPEPEVTEVINILAKNMREMRLTIVTTAQLEGKVDVE